MEIKKKSTAVVGTSPHTVNITVETDAIVRELAEIKTLLQSVADTFKKIVEVEDHA